MKYTWKYEVEYGGVPMWKLLLDGNWTKSGVVIEEAYQDRPTVYVAFNDGRILGQSDKLKIAKNDVILDILGIRF
jgi:hypothetical protein